MDSPVPSILLPRVRVPSTPSMLLKLLSNLSLHCEKNKKLFYFICRLFKQTSLQFQQQIFVKKCPSSIRWRDSNPRPLEHESPPITIRPVSGTIGTITPQELRRKKWTSAMKAYQCRHKIILDGGDCCTVSLFITWEQLAQMGSIYLSATARCITILTLLALPKQETFTPTQNLYDSFLNFN